MVTSMRHDGSMAFFELVASVHSAMQEGGGAEAMALGSGGGEGGHVHGIQPVWAPP